MRWRKKWQEEKGNGGSNIAKNKTSQHARRWNSLTRRRQLPLNREQNRRMGTVEHGFELE